MDAHWNGRATVNKYRITSIVNRTITNLALTLPGLTAQQISLSSSTQITTAGLQSSYEITQQWSAQSQFAYTRTEYIGSSRLDQFLGA